MVGLMLLLISNDFIKNPGQNRVNYQSEQKPPTKAATITLRVQRQYKSEKDP